MHKYLSNCTISCQTKLFEKYIHIELHIFFDSKISSDITETKVYRMMFCALIESKSNRSTNDGTFVHRRSVVQLHYLRLDRSLHASASDM